MKSLRDKIDKGNQIHKNYMGCRVQTYKAYRRGYMNLKKKLSIIVLLCFTLNMLLLFGYYELVLYDKIEESLNTMQIELRNDVNYISSQIKRLQGTDNIKDWINNIDNIDSINIKHQKEAIILYYMSIKHMKNHY